MGNYLAPGSPESQGQPNALPVNPPANPQIQVGVHVPANVLQINGPVAKYIQAPDVPAAITPTVQALKAEALLVSGPLPPPIYTQPVDVVRVQSPVPPPNAPQIQVGATYIPPADPARPVAPTIPVVNGNPLQIEGPLPAYEQPQDQPRPGDAPTVQSAVSSSTGVVRLE
jgi:hypothetical protein